jgi:hypothetical protein
VESSRLVEEIAVRSSRPAEWVCSHLVVAAQSADRRPRESLDAVALSRYARALEEAHPPGRLEVQQPLRLPEEMTGAWRRDAAFRHSTLAAWMSERLRTAPDGCVAWEIAAARACQSLAEWAYASSLRAMASSSA